MLSRDGSRDSSPSCEATTAIISLSPMSGVRSDGEGPEGGGGENMESSAVGSRRGSDEGGGGLLAGYPSPGGLESREELSGVAA